MSQPNPKLEPDYCEECEEEISTTEDLEQYERTNVCASCHEFLMGDSQHIPTTTFAGREKDYG